jgi:hypothetical protein
VFTKDIIFRFNHGIVQSSSRGKMVETFCDPPHAAAAATAAASYSGGDITNEGTGTA